MVFGAFQASLIVPYRSSRCWAHQAGQRDFAKSRTDGLLDLGPVRPERSRGQSSGSHSSRH